MIPQWETQRNLSLLTISLFLTACGGGGGGGGGEAPVMAPPSQQNPVETVAPAPVSPAMPSVPVAPPVSVAPPVNSATSSPTNDHSLPDSPLPVLPANSNPTLPTAAAEGFNAMLSDGLYEVTQGQLLRGTGTDCDAQGNSGNVTCIFLSKYFYSSDVGKFIVKSWMYEPLKRAWKPVDIVKSPVMGRPLISDLYSDGTSWFNNGLSFSDDQAIVKSDRLQYNYGNAIFDLINQANDLSGRTIKVGGYNEVTFSVGSRGYSFMYTLTQGQYIGVRADEPITSAAENSSRDNTVYNGLGDFRSAHTTPDKVYCLPTESILTGLVFNPSQPGGTWYHIEPCTKNIRFNTLAQSFNEGVATIAGRKVIYMRSTREQPVVNTSAVQKYIVIALNDQGKVNQGIALQTGYVSQFSTRFYNTIAITDQIKRMTQDSRAHVLPVG